MKKKMYKNVVMSHNIIILLQGRNNQIYRFAESAGHRQGHALCSLTSKSILRVASGGAPKLFKVQVSTHNKNIYLRTTRINETIIVTRCVSVYL